MLKSEVIDKIIADANYRNLCQRIDPKGDLYQNFILWLLEMSEDDVVHLYSLPYFNYYAVRVITQRRKLLYADEAWGDRRTKLSADMHELHAEEYDHDLDVKIQAVEQILDSLPVTDSGCAYDKLLFLESVEAGSLSELSRQTGINYKSIRRSVNATKQFIKSQVQNPAGSPA